MAVVAANLFGNDNGYQSGCVLTANEKKLSDGNGILSMRPPNTNKRTEAPLHRQTKYIEVNTLQ